MNVTGIGSSASEKSLGYAREVLGTDVALAPYLAEFQHHILAFAGVIDAALDQPEQAAHQPPTQN